MSDIGETLCPICGGVDTDPYPGERVCAHCGGAYYSIGPQQGPQELFLGLYWVDIVGYGGAAGGGKTFALLLDPLEDIDNPLVTACYFRREAIQITNPGGLWDSACRLWPRVGAKPKKRENRLGWQFPSGAYIPFLHLNQENDVLGYQGAQICLLYFDELTHFTPYQFWYMVSRSRSAEGVFKRIRCTFNPDATSWVKRMFGPWVDKTSPLYPTPFGQALWLVKSGDDDYQFFRRKDEAMAAAKERFRVPDNMLEHSVKSITFVEADLEDNRILMQNDPGYLANLYTLPEVERKRLLEKDWDVLAESFFGDWLPSTVGGQPWHVIPTGQCPEQCRYVIGHDWGFGKPFATYLIGIWPDGRVTICREIYGTKRNTRDLGLDMIRLIVSNGQANLRAPYDGARDPASLDDDALIDAVAHGRIGVDHIEIYAGHDVFNRRLNSKGEYDEPIVQQWLDMGLNVISAGRDPINRANKFRDHLRNWGQDEGWPEGRPGIQVMECCPNFIRTFPLLKSDKHNTEVVDTEMEDHGYDAVGHVLTSMPERPAAPRKEPEPEGRKIDKHLRKMEREQQRDIYDQF